jgi:hypothetical protein
VLATVFTSPLQELFRTRAVRADDLVAALIATAAVAALARFLARSGPKSLT